MSAETLEMPPPPEFEGSSDSPALNLTPAGYRQYSAKFAQYYSAPEYREWFNHLYPLWRYYNAKFFDSQLAVPHINIGQTTPRRFCECRVNTDNGGEINIVLAARVVFGTDRRLVRTDDPNATGRLRFTDDLLLGGTVKQYVLEVLGTDEDGYGGYGPRLAAEATRIGKMIGLPPVEPRRRGSRGRGLPVAAFWPWAFRPDGYYLGHVSLDHLLVAGLRTRQPVRLTAIPGVYEYFLYLLLTQRVARLTDILGRQVDAETVARFPAVAAAERVPQDASGMRLPTPIIDPEWLAWNRGCVRAIAEGIRTRRAFDGMPILADALQDAGCEDPVLLDHCRARTEHTAECWALRLLTPPA